MAITSGTACTFGAAIICVDLIVRQFPGKKHFKIEDSNSFLSTGLSLSFGVMIFSSLYSMLPSAKKYLITGGLTPRSATLILVACFMIGAFGISVLSSILHKYIPHTVVDCDHEHGDDEEGKVEDEEAGFRPQSPEDQIRAQVQSNGHNEAIDHSHEVHRDHHNPGLPARRPSLHKSLSSKVSQLVSGHQKLCDETGQCYGYSDTCGTECFKNALQTRPPRLHASNSIGNLKTPRPSGMSRIQTTPHDRRQVLSETTPLLPTRSGPTTMESSTASLQSSTANGTASREHPHEHTHEHERQSLQKLSRRSSTSSSSASSHAHDDHDHDHTASQHHHHVPTNIFLSIGLQTSTAIALHKIPEGFITYATNHANPTLGFSIFLALFIHNITEGFAMALPLYLALGSRWKAMFWSALLGGVSQPLGAGVAALWFKVAGAKRGGGHGEGEPSEIVYGCMFAITAGIMAMVSLQLLGESLDLTHSRRLCFVSAFAGMGILGLSSALTA